MSGSLVDAIDKRRRGPDVSAVPDSLRPLVQAMLRPDPKERLRSMDEVLARLDGTSGAAAPPPPGGPRSSLAEPDLSTPDRGAGSSATKWVIIAVAIVLLLAVAALGYSYFRDKQSGGGTTPPPGGGTVPQEIVATGDPANGRGRRSIRCCPRSAALLDIADIQAARPLTVALRGVAATARRDRSGRSALAHAKSKIPSGRQDARASPGRLLVAPRLPPYQGARRRRMFASRPASK